LSAGACANAPTPKLRTPRASRAKRFIKILLSPRPSTALGAP
jgi:hypothetical protein